MTDQQIIAKTEEFVKSKFENEGTGHDWWHIYRVQQLSKKISRLEKDADTFIVELSALLHDIADWKFNNGDIEAGPKAARAWLESINVHEGVIQKVEDIVRNVSYKGADVLQDMKSIEGQIVSDADKLDAMGAIGIARAFTFGGAHNRPMYDPNIKPEMHKTFEEYKKAKSHTINHFYEKLLLLKGKLYTDTAKEIALHRHRVMEQYLKEFYKEWEGN